MKQLYVFLGVFFILSALQIFWELRFMYVRKNRQIGTEEGQDKIKFMMNFRRRLKIAWVLFIIGMIPFGFGYLGLTIFFMLVSFLALREFVSVMPLKPSDYWPMFCSFYVFLPLQYFFVLTNVPFLFYIFIPVYVFLLSPMLAVASDDNEQFFERASKFQWCQIACIYCISYVPAIAGLELKNGFQSSTLLLFYAIIVFTSDTFQYVFGNYFGERKVAPKISPDKTWEGLIGGIILSTLIGTFMWWLTPFAWWQAMLLALMVSSVGFIGTLVMSGIKGSLKITKWSDLLSSHGGVLDRVDSLIFTAPLFYHVCKYCFSNT